MSDTDVSTDVSTVSATITTVDIGNPDAKVIDRNGKPGLQIWPGGVGSLCLFATPEGWRRINTAVEAALKEAGL